MENEIEELKKEHQRQQKRSFALILLLLLVAFVSVGYAALSSTLNIRGSSTINNPTWDVGIEDGAAISCPTGEKCTINPSNPDSLTPDDGTGDNAKGAIIWTDGNTVYFKHVLTKPGDSFTFTTEFSNNGTIDAKVDTVTKSNLNATAQNFMTYNVTYANGNTINSGDLLRAGESVSFKVSVTYKSTVSVLPTAEQLALINETSEGNTGATSLFTVNYVQA